MKNKENGITLIALIITIIVMLILVGVTINVAISGGLFTKAQNAKTQTQAQTEKEELVSIAVGAYDAQGSKIIEGDLNLGDNFTKDTEKSTSDKIVVKAKDTNNLWQIDVNSAKVGEYVKTESKEIGSIYDVAYISSETDKGVTTNFVIIIKNNGGTIIYYLIEYNEDFSVISDAEAEIVTIGSKSQFENDIKTDYFPEADFETEIRDEVTVQKGEIWGAFRISDSQEVYNDGKTEYIRNDNFDISDIDFSNISYLKDY